MVTPVAYGTITVRSYASSANLGPGFDALGVALDAFYDEVTLVLDKGKGNVVVEEVKGPYAEDAGGAATAVSAIRKFMELLEVNNADVYMSIYKGIPPGRGLGSSGASAAAAVKAMGIAYGVGDIEILVKSAGYGEVESAGTPHYDNVSASLLGGLVVVAQSSGGIRVASIPLDAWFTIIVPMDPVPPGKTGVMRSVLPRMVPLEKAVSNWSRLAMLVASAYRGNIELLGEMMSQDSIIEPARSRFIPCYTQLRRSLLSRGEALGFTISGAGPSMIALARDKSHAEELAVLALESCDWKREPIIKATHTAPAAHRV